MSSQPHLPHYYYMCKRTAERLNNHPKRLRATVQPTYTQGPLDSVFGQHRAFPLDLAPQSHDDAAVYQYLSGVRSEAERDPAVHYVERERSSRVEQSAAVSTDALSAEFVALVRQRILDEKRKHNETTEMNEADETNGDETNGDEDGDSISEGEDNGDSEDNEGDSAEDGGDSEGNGAGGDDGVEDIEGTAVEGEETHSVPSSAGQWRELIFSTLPPPQSYFSDVLEHPTVIKLVVYYTRWLLALMPSTLTEWIFATFVRLDSELDHTELALVRDLGRKAQKLRRKFLEGEQAGAVVPQVARDAVDLVLAAVGGYYGQRDLLV